MNVTYFKTSSEAPVSIKQELWVMVQASVGLQELREL